MNTEDTETKLEVHGVGFGFGRFIMAASMLPGLLFGLEFTSETIEGETEPVRLLSIYLGIARLHFIMLPA